MAILKNAGVIIDQRKGAELYRIGITAGNKDTFYFYANSLEAAQDCAQWLKVQAEEILELLISIHYDEARQPVL